jgi:trans-aconitate methyltransferase
MAEFDQYAKSYDTALAEGLAATGEDKDYFARERVRWVRRCLSSLGAPCRTVLDYGCGTGSAVPWLLAECQPERVVGVDLSVESVAQASAQHGSGRAVFHSIQSFRPAADIDLAFCNGVFHHIPIAERPTALGYIAQALRPGGLFALWENNPWNPGTRYVMSRIPFDRDAITLSVLTARRLLRFAQFEVLRTDFLFVFPRMLSALRWLEPGLAKLPLGGQYQVLCRKPAQPRG